MHIFTSIILTTPDYVHDFALIILLKTVLCILVCRYNLQFFIFKIGKVLDFSKLLKNIAKFCVLYKATLSV